AVSAARSWTRCDTPRPRKKTPTATSAASSSSANPPATIVARRQRRTSADSTARMFVPHARAPLSELLPRVHGALKRGWFDGGNGARGVVMRSAAARAELPVRRLLVVGNETAAGPMVEEAVRFRAA